MSLGTAATKAITTTLTQSGVRAVETATQRVGSYTVTKAGTAVTKAGTAAPETLTAINKTATTAGKSDTLLTQTQRGVGEPNLKNLEANANGFTTAAPEVQYAAYHLETGFNRVPISVTKTTTAETKAISEMYPKVTKSTSPINNSVVKMEEAGVANAAKIVNAEEAAVKVENAAIKTAGSKAGGIIGTLAVGGLAGAAIAGTDMLQIFQQKEGGKGNGEEGDNIWEKIIEQLKAGGTVPTYLIPGDGGANPNVIYVPWDETGDTGTTPTERNGDNTGIPAIIRDAVETVTNNPIESAIIGAVIVFIIAEVLKQNKSKKTKAKPKAGGAK